MLLYGAVGIVLVIVGRFFHDKLVLNRMDKNKLIAEKNVSVALIDASSSIASAIIIKSIINWSVGTDVNTLVAILSGTMITLSILLLTTRLYEISYASNNQNSGFQRALSQGQMALAIKHSGNLIGTAIVVSSAGAILVYEPESYVSNMTGWFFTGVSFSIFLMLLTNISKRIILSGVNWKKEVDLQHNVGIASIEFVLSVGLATLVAQLFIA
jgi:uncharacterized membrane protein YjfL (UPF0719 family)